MVYLNNKKFILLFLEKFNLFFLLGIILLGIINFYLFENNSLNSWLFLISHMLDTHQGWVLSIIWFTILITYLISFSKQKKNKQLYFCAILTFALIIISSPLQHNLYGGDQWSSGIIEGIPIYNFYDESQTRSFLQLLLTFAPLGVLRVKNLKN